MYFKEGYKIRYVGEDSMHTDACKKAAIKSQCIRTAELTTRTPENGNSSLSDLYPEVSKALKMAKLLKKGKLPKLGNVLDARREEVRVAAEKKKKRILNKRTVFIKETYANNWRKVPLHVVANKLAKSIVCTQKKGLVLK